jgi:hypothetical protein
MAMRIAVIVFLGFAATACADTASSVQTTGAEAGGEDDPVAAKVITAAPSTFEVALEEEVPQRLELHLGRGSLDIARLVVRDLRPRAAQSLKGVRIFIEKPDAHAGTPVDDPHYAGSFVLGLEDSQTMLLNVAPTLARLWRSGDLAGRKALRITFVPEPWDFADALPEEFALSFESLTLEVPADPPPSAS